MFGGLTYPLSLLAATTFALTLFFSRPASAQELAIDVGWKGIKIFQTTRDELEGLYGQPVKNENYLRFETADEVIDVVFSGTPCTFPIGNTRYYSFQKGTVIEYTVGMLKPFPLSRIILKIKDFERKEDQYHRDSAVYRNPTIGVTVATLINKDHSEEVIAISYIPRRDQELPFACSPK